METTCVNVEQFPATNVNVRLLEGCIDGKVPTVRVSTEGCADFAAVATLAVDTCIPVTYSPQAYSISCD